jgi:hypothetical protein
LASRSVGGRVGLHIDLFEACSAFTRVAACPLALSPIRDTLIEGFSHFVTSMTAPIASGGSEFAGWVLHPLESAAFFTAHAESGHSQDCNGAPRYDLATPSDLQEVRARNSDM